MNAALDIKNTTYVPSNHKKAYLCLPSSTQEKHFKKNHHLNNAQEKEKKHKMESNQLPEQSNKENSLPLITNEDLQSSIKNGKYILAKFKKEGFKASSYKSIIESKTEITEMMFWNKKSTLLPNANTIINDLIDLEKNTLLYRSICSAKSTFSLGKSGNTSTSILDEIMLTNKNAGAASCTRLRSEAQNISHKLETLLYSYENYFNR